VIPTLRDFGSRYVRDCGKANRNKPRTIEEKVSILEFHLYPRLGNRRLDEIRLADDQRLKGDLEDLSTSRLNNILNVLSTVLFAVDVEIMRALQVTIRLLKVAPAEVGFCEPDIYEKIVASARELDPRAYPMVLIGAFAAGRSRPSSRTTSTSPVASCTCVDRSRRGKPRRRRAGGAARWT
jgi:hypothetical protein